MSINYHALARPIKLSLVSTAKNEKRLIVHSKIYVHKSVNKFALPELYTRNVKNQLAVILCFLNHIEFQTFLDNK